jgi:hypothetical protein
MTTTRARLLACVLAVAHLALSRGSAAQTPAPAPLVDGTHVDAEGRFDSGGRFIARGLEALDAPELGVKGPLDAWDASSRTLTFGPLRLPLAADAKVATESAGAGGLETLAAGRRVKVKLEQKGATLTARSLLILDGTGGSLHVRGPVISLATERAGARCRLLGVDVDLSQVTSWTGLRPIGAQRGAPAAEDHDEAAAPAAPPAKPRELAVGDLVVAKGTLGKDLVLHAREIALVGEDKPSLKGPIDRIEAGARTLVFGPMRLVLDDETSVQDEEGEPLPLGKLRAGDRVKVRLDVKADRPAAVKRIQRLGGKGGSFSAQGRVISVTPSGQRYRFRLQGLDLDIGASTSTDWVSILPPRAALDPDDRRLEEAIALGKGFALSGEVRLDYRVSDDADLTERLADRLAWARLRTELELLFPTSKHVTGMAELKAQRQWAVSDDREDQSGAFPTESDLRPGETWLMVHGGSRPRRWVQVGRLLYDDERDWLYRHDVDGLRGGVEWTHLSVHASVTQEKVDPPTSQEDIRNAELRVSWQPTRRHAFDAWIFDRDDRYRPGDGVARDFSPRLIGVSARGKKKDLLSYWGELVVERGSMGGKPLRAHALDVGATFILPGSLEPSLTFGHARATGDPHPADGIAETFRQSGLHRNNGKWNGVTNFKVYGEALDPELSNLKVDTIGFGLRPRAQTSIDLVYHRYRLGEPAGELTDADIGDRRLDFHDLDVGHGWDLVVGVEEWRSIELELDVGLFSPGKAFLGPTDDALVVNFKCKVLLGS